MRHSSLAGDDMPPSRSDGECAVGMAFGAWRKFRKFLLETLGRRRATAVAMPAPQRAVKYQLGKLIGYVVSTKMNKSVRPPRDACVRNSLRT